MFFSQKVFAFENGDEITIESGKKQLVLLSKVKKFTLSLPKIAEIKKEGDWLVIKGMAAGSSQLYVWTENEFNTYLITTTSPNFSVSKKYNLGALQRGDKPTPKGFLSFQGGDSINGNKSNQNIFQTISFEYPFDKNHYLKLNANSYLNSSDIKNLDTVSFKNLSLTYKNNFFTSEVGDLSTNALGGFGAIRGLNFSFENSFSKTTFFSGTYQLPIFIYNKEDNLNAKDIDEENVKSPFDKDYIIGFSNNTTIFNRFNLDTSLNSLVNFSNLESNKYNFSLGLNGKPFDNLFLGLNTFGNHEKLSFSYSSSYKYVFDNKIENLELQTNYNRSLGNGFYDKFEPFNTYGISLKTHHRSDINILTSYSKYEYVNQLDKNKSNFLVSLDRKIINDKNNLYGSFLFEDANEIKNLTYQTGFNSNDLYIPSIDYKFTKNKIFDFTTFIYDLSSNIRFLSNDITNLSLSSKFSYINPKTEEVNLNSYKNLKDSFIFNSSITNDWVFNNNFNSSFSISYLLANRDSVSEGYLISSAKLGFRYLSHNIVLNSFWEKKLTQSNLNNNNLNFNVSYMYNFSNLFEDSYTGSIKGVIFEDANSNEIYDKNEKTFENINIVINDKVLKTNKNGYSFNNVDYDTYNIVVDEKSLPLGYKNTSDKSVSFDLNTHEKIINFPVNKKVLIKGTVFSNKRNTASFPNIRLILDSKEEIFTDPSGNFYFNTFQGNHDLAIVSSDIPENYISNSPLKITLSSLVKDKEFDFNFYPIISIKGTLKEGNISLNNKDISYKFKNNFIEYEKTLKTDENGNFYIFDLEEGSLILKYKNKEKVIEIPSIPKDINLIFDLNK